MTTSETVYAWQQYLAGIDDWNPLIEGIVPKNSGCGLIYELPNFLGRPNESFAIADMRQIECAEPHYHRNETEIYFVLQGDGIVVLGGIEQAIQKGSVITIVPHVAHFTIPQENLVLAVVNTPPFSIEDYFPLHEENKSVGFDSEQFHRLNQPALPRCQCS